VSALALFQVILVIARYHHGLFMEKVFTPLAKQAIKEGLVSECGTSMKHRMVLPSIEELKKHGIDYDVVLFCFFI
jgi:hypothetical protein